MSTFSFAPWFSSESIVVAASPVRASSSEESASIYNLSLVSSCSNASQRRCNEATNCCSCEIWSDFGVYEVCCHLKGSEWAWRSSVGAGGRGSSEARR